MAPEQFLKLSIEKKLDLLKAEGEYIGARDVTSHFVYLFAFKRFFVEVYKLKSLNQIQWIEVQSNSDILKEYIEDLDLGEL